MQIIRWMINGDTGNDYKKSLHICVIFCIVLIVLNVVAFFIPVQGEVTFREGDPTLSFPVKKEQITAYALAFLCCVVPGIVIGFAYVITRQNKNWNLFLCWGTTIYVSLLTTLLVTQLLKIAFGELRPNFFHLCNYQHINDSGSYYLSNFHQDQPGSFSFCYGNYRDIQNSRSSFPSGHTSCSFSIAVSIILFLWQNDLVSVWNYCPLLIAMYIGLTRIQDRYHHFHDVFFGAILGLLVTCLVWYLLSLRLRAFNKKMDSSLIKAQITEAFIV